MRPVRAGEPWRIFDHNPLALPLEIRVDGRVAEADLEPNVLMEGPPRLMHGGLSAALLDSLLSTWLRCRTGESSRCDST